MIGIGLFIAGCMLIIAGVQLGGWTAMERWEKRFWTGMFFLILVGLALGQDKPSLSTADRTAIAAMEQKKADAQKAYNEAQQNELVILREWQVAHPGWIINQQTFAIEAEKKAEGKK